MWRIECFDSTYSLCVEIWSLIYLVFFTLSPFSTPSSGSAARMSRRRYSSILLFLPLPPLPYREIKPVTT